MKRDHVRGAGGRGPLNRCRPISTRMSIKNVTNIMYKIRLAYLERTGSALFAWDKKVTRLVANLYKIHDGIVRKSSLRKCTFQK